jgi:hypothetical protein
VGKGCIQIGSAHTGPVLFRWVGGPGVLLKLWQAHPFGVRGQGSVAEFVERSTRCIVDSIPAGGALELWPWTFFPKQSGWLINQLGNPSFACASA